MYKYYILIISLTPSGSGVTLTSNLTRSIHQFASNLYDVLPGDSGNVIFSPLSGHAALSMVYLGSDGETSEILRLTLNLLDKYNQSVEYRNIMKLLNENSEVKAAVANMVFIQSLYKINDQYEKLIEYYFSATATNVDFRKRKETVHTINDSVANKTDDVIQHLISSNDLDESTRLVLVNSLYLKGNWTQKFAAVDTEKRRFHLNQNDTVHCHMMCQSNYFKYFENSNPHYQVVQLKLADPSYSMIVVLPKMGDFEIVEAQLSDENATFVTVDNKLTMRLVNLSLPKFKFESQLDLQYPLYELGLENIFSNSASFSKMINSGDSLKVDKVVQKSYIETNEMGIEAASSTGMTMTKKKRLPPIGGPPVSFNANRRFIFYIIEELENVTTPNILFMGRLNSPTVIY